jgi:hypothetical protein
VSRRIASLFYSELWSKLAPVSPPRETVMDLPRTRVLDTATQKPCNAPAFPASICLRSVLIAAAVGVSAIVSRRLPSDADRCEQYKSVNQAVTFRIIARARTNRKIESIAARKSGFLRRAMRQHIWPTTVSEI